MKNLSHIPACALALMAAWPLHATTVVGTGTPGSCTEAALEAAIAEANSTSGLVTFNCGPASHTITLGSQKSLGDGVAIDGGNRIRLSGNDATRIFSLFQGAAVSISNIALVHGFTATDGGCILAASSDGNESRLDLANVDFLDCRANLYGGAIAASQAFLTTTDGFYTRNSAGRNGGVIHVTDGTLGIGNGHFEINLAFTQGGVVQALSSALTIEDSTFYFNDTIESTGGGAALALGGSTAMVDDCYFVRNLAGRDGGAVLLLAGSSASIEDSRFQFNLATKDGGAIYADNSSSASVSSSSFWDNRSEEDGGAIDSRFDLTLRNSTFYENQTRFNGYAVFVEAGSLDMVSSTMIDSFSSATPGSGQLAWSAGTTVEVHNSLLQSPRRPAFACAAGGPASFSATMWDDLTCPEGGAGNKPNTVVALRGFGYSCGGTASERTPTVPFAAGASPALYAGSCRVGDPAFDQRGMPRPTGASCDMGAAEFFEPCDAPLFGDGFESGNTQLWSVSVP
jgi:predicted outer membrane repeat protein